MFPNISVKADETAFLKFFLGDLRLLLWRPTAFEAERKIECRDDDILTTRRQGGVVLRALNDLAIVDPALFLIDEGRFTRGYLRQSWEVWIWCGIMEVKIVDELKKNRRACAFLQNNLVAADDATATRLAVYFLPREPDELARAQANKESCRRRGVFW